MKSNGIFLQFDKELQRALLEVGVRDAPATREEQLGSEETEKC
jgi:hypothetical protein